MTTRWGLLAAGQIAAEFAEAVHASSCGELLAVGARDAKRAEAFAQRFAIPRHYGSYEELLADPDVDVIYISTPHSAHGKWAIRAMEEGKHVLCEKPLTLNHAEAVEVVRVARACDRFLMEAYMYRLHPQTRRLIELIADGALGEVRGVEVSFGYDGPQDGRIASRELGGGGILDIGGYCVSVARAVASAATGIAPIEPEEVTGLATIDPVSGVDTNAVASMRFPGGILAQLSCSTAVERADYIRVYGSSARLEITQPPWVAEMRAPGTSSLVLTPSDGLPQVIEVRAELGLFAAEADYVAEHLAARQGPELSWPDTLANMRTMDRWRAAVGLPV